MDSDNCGGKLYIANVNEQEVLTAGVCLFLVWISKLTFRTKFKIIRKTTLHCYPLQIVIKQLSFNLNVLVSLVEFQIIKKNPYIVIFSKSPLMEPFSQTFF